MSFVLICDGCDAEISYDAETPEDDRLLAGRWKCAQCGDFDLCAGCVQTNAHVHSHCFLHITAAPTVPLGGVVFLPPYAVRAPISISEAAAKASGEASGSMIAVTAIVRWAPFVMVVMNL